MYDLYNDNDLMENNRETRRFRHIEQDFENESF